MIFQLPLAQSRAPELSWGALRTSEDQGTVFLSLLLIDYTYTNNKCYIHIYLVS